MDPPAVAANLEGRWGSFTRARGSGGRVVRELQAKPPGRQHLSRRRRHAVGTERTAITTYSIRALRGSEWVILTYNESAWSDC